MWHFLPHRKALPSHLRSYGLMRQTKILHSASHYTILYGLCRLPLASAGSWIFPTLSPQVFPQVPGPLSRWAPMVNLPVSTHRNIGLPQANNGSAFPHHSVQRLQYGSAFETAVIPLCSGPQVCSPLRSLPPQSELTKAAVTFTSEHLTVRYLTAPRIC